MIPTYNCAQYLRQTLTSVLAQDPGAGEMQIEVVDDCSTKDDPESVVREAGGGRVAFYRKPSNEGAIRTFNTCLERSRGHLVHILHGDDYVERGFYAAVGAAADRWPSTAFFCTRSVTVDPDGRPLSEMAPIGKLSAPGNDVRDFYYVNPIRTPGVVIRRSFYEQHGGYRVELVHTADWEMWLRAIRLGGGVVLDELLAYYRSFPQNDTGRLTRTAENIRDLDRYAALLSRQAPDFDITVFRQMMADLALRQAETFSDLRDCEAAQANWSAWRKLSPWHSRLRKALGRSVRAVLAPSLAAKASNP